MTARSRWVMVGVAIVAAVAALALWLVPSDENDDASPPTTSTASTTEPTASTSTTTTTATPAPTPTALWPWPGSAQRFATPEDAARSFATDFLRFEAPVVEAFRAGDSRSGEVPVRAIASGPVTTVLVRQVGPGDDWSVLAAVTDGIEVTSPAPGEEIASPVDVRGRAVAFEGTVQVEVRADGDLGPIGAGVVTGGGDEPRPFAGSIAFETAGAPFGALVLYTVSGEDGQVWEAAALRVALRSSDVDAMACDGFRSPRPSPDAGEMEVKIYFSCDAADGRIHPVYRLVDESTGVLRAALEALLAGPNDAERAVALSSWFSPATAELLRSVNVVDGHAIVDFDDLRPVIPNASASAGSAMLFAQLDATVFQFRSVDSVEYRLQGSCEDFNEWLQLGGCEPRTRPVSTD